MTSHVFASWGELNAGESGVVALSALQESGEGKNGSTITLGEPNEGSQTDATSNDDESLVGQLEKSDSSGSDATSSEATVPSEGTRESGRNERDEDETPKQEDSANEKGVNRKSEGDGQVEVKGETVVVEPPASPGIPWQVTGAIGVLVGLVIALVVARIGRVRSRREFEQRRAARRSKRQQNEFAADSPHATISAIEIPTDEIPTGEVPAAQPAVVSMHKTVSMDGASMPAISFGVAALHEQGAREQQQDSFGISDVALQPTHGQLAIVADGMGGLENGAQVSEAACQAVLDAFLVVPPQSDSRAMLLSLVRVANKAVNELLGPAGYRTSGSTLLLAYLNDGRLDFVSIGDSRLYLLRNGELMLLNREHEFANDLAVRVVNDEMSIQEAFSNEERAGLVSFLGMGRIEHLDMPAESMRLFKGDKVVLMSDGVYNALAAEEMTEALMRETPDAACAELRARIAAKAYTNQDNYTAIVLSCDGAAVRE